MKNFKNLELPDFLLHYEIQVETMPKTSDEDEYRVKIIQHHENKSKVVETLISISGYEKMLMSKKPIVLFSTVLLRKLAVVFLEGIEKISDDWDKLTDFQRMDYQKIKDICYIPVIEKCSECEKTLCDDHKGE